MRASAPGWLHKGLHLEDRNVLLPWGADESKIGLLGEPTKSGSGEERLLCWLNARVLRGLTASVGAKIDSHRGLRELELHLGGNEESPTETMTGISSHLRSLFGPPTRVHKSDQDQTATETWLMTPITISHGVFERFGHYYQMRIQHRGPIDHEMSAA